MNITNIIDKESADNTMIMAFILKIVVFILGFLIVYLGYLLIRDGVKGSFKFSSEAKGLKGALESSSPGLLFVLLGTILIGYGMFVKKGVEVIPTDVNGSNPEVNNKEQAPPPSIGEIDPTMNPVPKKD